MIDLVHANERTWTHEELWGDDIEYFDGALVNAIEMPVVDNSTPPRDLVVQVPRHVPAVLKLWEEPVETVRAPVQGPQRSAEYRRNRLRLKKTK